MDDSLIVVIYVDEWILNQHEQILDSVPPWKYTVW